MSRSDFFSTLRSSDHDFIATLRFLDDYAKHIYERGRHHQAYHHFVPRFDLEQRAETYELYGELPGFRREDIIIEAHDHNLQVSGSTSRLASEPQPSSESKESSGETTKPQAQEAAKEASKGGELKPSRESASGAKKPGPKPDPLEATTTDEERYLNARFGDVLDPHANFVRGQDDTEASDDATDPVPKVRYLISERHPSVFYRAFHFPTPVKNDEVVATMQDGILHITAPRAPMLPPVKVPVSNHLEYYPAVLV